MIIDKKVCLPPTEDKQTRPTKKNFKRLSKYVIFTVFRLISVVATGKTVPRVSFLEGCRVSQFYCLTDYGLPIRYFGRVWQKK